jgi:hypothetical protein
MQRWTERGRAPPRHVPVSSIFFEPSNVENTKVRVDVGPGVGSGLALV